ncbi:MAG TPA: hypothetical protein VJU15_00485 [Gemmatimonadales bacterium]|nr:hypothetical protein [Gemmatimonadales bacterium]
MTRSRAGLALTAPVAVLGLLLGGWRGALAATAFGLLATLIQVAAGRTMGQHGDSATRDYMKAWASGMGLRMLGVLLVGVVIWRDSAWCPPVPAAMGYIGVLVPLLFFEARRL